MSNVMEPTSQQWPAPLPPPPTEQTAEQIALALQELSDDLPRAKARAVLALVTAEYGASRWPRMGPVAALVEVLLSHRTTDAAAMRAFTNLRKRWPRWDDLRDAPVEDLETEIHDVTWPEQKAPRIKKVLQEITARRGTINLDFLKDIDLGEANNWLTSLDGVGPKSAACVLLFSCRRPLLPVDTHVFRVSGRVGLIGPKVSAEKAHTILQALLPDPEDAQQVLNFHMNVLLHGQRVCVWRDPKCERCVLREWCDYYKDHPEKQAKVARLGEIQ